LFAMLPNETFIYKGYIPFSSEYDREWLNQVNNSVIFSEKPMRSEEFLNHMVEALGIILAIIIDRSLKGRPRRMDS